MSSRTSARIAVLKGGRSAEREVSLVSGRECAAALRNEGYDVVEIDAGPDVASEFSRPKSRTSSSTPCMAAGARTAVFRACWSGCAFPTPIPACWPRRWPWTRSAPTRPSRRPGCRSPRPSGLPGRGARRRIRWTPPYVVKPYNEGSSVGVYLVHEGANGPAQVSDDMPDILMVERLRSGPRADHGGTGRPGAGRDRHHRRRLVRLSREILPRRIAARRSRPRFPTRSRGPVSTMPCAPMRRSAAAASAGPISAGTRAAGSTGSSFWRPTPSRA